MSYDRLVLLLGSQSRWTETGHGQKGRHDCPVCRHRNLSDERRRDLNRTCLRCLTSTWDFEPARPPARSHPIGRPSADRHSRFAPTRRQRRAAMNPS